MEKGNAMNAPNDHWMVRHASYDVDPTATAHDLFNDAREWLHYARALTELLADVVHEEDAPENRRLAISLEAIGALTHMGLQCVAHGHARMQWEAASLAT